MSIYSKGFMELKKKKWTKEYLQHLLQCMLSYVMDGIKQSLQPTATAKR